MAPCAGCNSFGCLSSPFQLPPNLRGGHGGMVQMMMCLPLCCVQAVPAGSNHDWPIDVDAWQCLALLLQRCMALL